MFRIQRFNVLKTATVAAVIYMVVVAIFVVPFVLLVAFARLAAPAGVPDASAIGAFGFGLFAILIYGLLGWIGTAIACVIYNGVAAWIGGIEVQVEAVAPPPAPPAWITEGQAPGPPAAPAS